jgi:hypothetical protein
MIIHTKPSNAAKRLRRRDNWIAFILSVLTGWLVAVISVPITDWFWRFFGFAGFMAAMVLVAGLACLIAERTESRGRY